MFHLKKSRRLKPPECSEDGGLDRWFLQEPEGDVPNMSSFLPHSANTGCSKGRTAAVRLAKRSGEFLETCSALAELLIEITCLINA